MSSRVTEARERPQHGPARGGSPHGGRVVEKPINFGPSLRRLLGHLKPERAVFIAITILAAISVTLTVIGPRILGWATDIIFTGVIGSRLPAGVSKDSIVEQLRESGQTTFADMLERLDVVPGQGIQFDDLGRVVLLGLAVYVAAGILAWATGYLISGAVQRSIYRMRDEVSQKLSRLPLKYFDSQPRGELLSRVTNDVDNISQTLQQTLSQLLTALLTLIGVAIMMLLTSPILAGIALLLIPVAGVVTALIGKQAQTRFVAMWKNTGELNSHIEEAFTGHALVKTYGHQRASEAEFARRNDALFSASFGAQAISGLIMPVMFFLGNVNYAVIAIVGGLRVASGQLSLGDVQAFIQYSRMFTQPITQVASMANLLQSGVASAERVFQVLDADELSPDATGALPPTQGLVEFDAVSFSYTDEPLIAGLDLTASTGATVAIVGPTGAGKTTLVNLLMRFYEVDGGQIRLDGVNIADVPRAELRSRIGMVLQDTWLFGGTIRDNIAYGNPDASEEQIMAAAEASFVDRFVHGLPEGYDTIIDDDAGNLSAGEKQLITIARAFLADPDLLILDEATSSVDTRTEVLVQEAMGRLRQRRTSFVIAHRLSTIRDADVIVVMEDGAIVEQGSHEDLVHREGGHYRSLYESQFASPATDGDTDS